MMAPTSAAAREQGVARGHLKRPENKSELRGTAKGQRPDRHSLEAF